MNTTSHHYIIKNRTRFRWPVHADRKRRYQYFIQQSHDPRTLSTIGEITPKEKTCNSVEKGRAHNPAREPIMRRTHDQRGPVRFELSNVEGGFAPPDYGDAFCPYQVRAVPDPRTVQYPSSIELAIRQFRHDGIGRVVVADRHNQNVGRERSVLDRIHDPNIVFFVPNRSLHLAAVPYSIQNPMRLRVSPEVFLHAIPPGTQLRCDEIFRPRKIGIRIEPIYLLNARAGVLAGVPHSAQFMRSF
mmetsp:Transcript_3330/g.8484  ORF Transcript_3330/g.8484 Transcript_3330/m.8484 type:complete len:244 (+) Transcript_3330:771-1502(+)